MSSTEEKAQVVSQATLEALERLVEVVAQLRSPQGGCPWDLAQTPETLIPYVIEEAYEVVDAIRTGDSQAIAEELGDLLLQVVLQSQIAGESQQFSLAEVAQGITEKLIRRHPHVFANVSVDSADEVRHNWEQIKALEKGETLEEAQLISRKLAKYSRSLPPLTAGMKISQKAAQQGFEWENVEGVWEKFQEELAEFREALQKEDEVQQKAEFGDILFTLINIARWYNIDPTEALQGTNKRFSQRFAKMETLAENSLTEYGLEQLEALWQQAKADLKTD
ncbi:MAG: nucleoside triphosphate pyrophosphohydrolase [Spirulinaceae cyanobacterium]